jgi:hypothetical protein
MKTVLIILVPVFLFVFADRPVVDADKYISVEKLISNNSISAEIIGLGGYQENCISFDLRNTTSDTLHVWIEPGRRLISDDSTLQDILLVKESKIELLPNERKNLHGYGFCCEASMHAPGPKSVFSIGTMAPTPWVKLADVINKNNFPPEAIQHAVWVFSNNHALSSVADDNTPATDLLRRTIASIKGIEMPWYSIRYEKDTAMLFSGRPEKVYGTLEYYLKTNAIVTINVRNKNGTLVATLMKAMAHNPGKYLFDVDLPVKNWQKGSYEINIYEDYSNLNLKKKFEL